MDALDIFVWPDGRWCYRAEWDLQIGRDRLYRLVKQYSEDWFFIARNATAKLGLPK